MKRVLFLLAFAFCVVALTSFNTAAAGPDKVKICHCSIQPDELEPNGWFVIEVSPSAVPGHQRHGDCVYPDYTPLTAEVGDQCECPVVP